MLMAALMAGAAGLGRLIAGEPAPQPAAVPARDDRRATWLESHPGEVTAADVRRELEAHGLPAADLALVTDAARRSGIKPFTQWMFLRSYGAAELAVAAVGEMTHDDMLDCLSFGTLPAFGELEVLAGVHGLRTRLGRTPVAAGTAASDDPGPDDDPDGPDGGPRRLGPGWDSFFDDLVA